MAPYEKNKQSTGNMYCNTKHMSGLQIYVGPSSSCTIIQRELS